MFSEFEGKIKRNKYRETKTVARAFNKLNLKNCESVFL